MSNNEDEMRIVAELRDQYEYLHDNLDEVMAACDEAGAAQPAEARKAFVDNLKRQYGESVRDAFRNYIEAQNRIFNETKAKLAQLDKAAVKAQGEIEDALNDLKNIKATLNKITKAVKAVAVVVATLT